MDSEISIILKKISENGFEVSIVGGAIRDILSKKEVKDWDLTTNAKPEEVLKIFKGAFYNNKFGTVGIPIKDKTKTVQITTYRSEEGYRDARHPDKVRWGESLEEDLKRRDFTINAIAITFSADKPFSAWSIVDPYGGQADFKKKILKAVGDPEERFKEDALRLIRAVRFCASLNFNIEEKTKKAITKNRELIGKISGERIRDELFKIIDGENNAEAIFLLKELKLLEYILPELDVCFKVEQKSPKRHHIFDVGTHCVMSMKFCPSKDTLVRFATMLHDVGKAKVANVTEEGVRTFYNHEVVGAHQAGDIAKRFNLSSFERDKLFKLVRWHQFSVNENQTDKAIRRFVTNVGLVNVEDMMDLRIGDRLGGGLQQPESWRLKLFRKRLKEVLLQPFSVKDLKINGEDVMKELKISPGPKVGEILNKLFEEVAEDKKKNTKEFLLKKLSSLSDLES